MAPVTELVLLNPPAGVFHRFESQPDHVKGVEHRDSVLELVIDGMGIATQRVQGRDLHSSGEPGPTGLQPAGVGRSRAAGDQVDQPRLNPISAVRVGLPGQIDHPGELFGSLPGRGAWCQMCSSTPRASTPDRDTISLHCQPQLTTFAADVDHMHTKRCSRQNASKMPQALA